MTETIALLAGYIASGLLAISLLLNNDLKFRWFNTCGNIFFITYGLLIQAFPVILTNVILLLINLFYLVKIYRTRENFDLFEIKEDDQLIHKFLSFYANDIKAFFPEFRKTDMNSDVCFIVLRDLVIANIFIADVSADGNATVKINYTIPKYRDYKVGKFIFEKEKQYLLAKGINRIVYKKVFHKNHESFLRVMGFKKDAAPGNTNFSKSLL